MRRLLNEIALLLFIVSKMILGDKHALTSTFLVLCEHKHTEDVVFSRVLKTTEDFPVGIEFEGWFDGICLIEAVGRKKCQF